MSGKKKCPSFFLSDLECRHDGWRWGSCLGPWDRKWWGLQSSNIEWTGSYHTVPDDHGLVILHRSMCIRINFYLFKLSLLWVFCLTTKLNLTSFICRWESCLSIAVYKPIDDLPVPATYKSIHNNSCPVHSAREHRFLPSLPSLPSQMLFFFFLPSWAQGAYWGR